MQMQRMELIEAIKEIAATHLFKVTTSDIADDLSDAIADEVVALLWNLWKKGTRYDLQG